MKSRSTIADVARLAGVSTATVSRVLSSPEVVSEVTRRAVEAAVRRLGYVPLASAQALASGRSMAIGCVVPTLDHAIFARSTQALQQRLASSGYQLLVASHGYDPARELEVVQTLQRRGVDGLVLVGTQHSPALWKNLLRWDKPAVLTWSCDGRLPSVGFDNHAAGARAIDFLVGLGHRRIGHISGELQHNDRARSRMEGVRAALRRHRLKLPAGWVSEQPFNLQGGASGLRSILESGERPTAIFCGNDLLAAGVIFEAQRLGLRVPQDLSVLGIDNQALAESMVPSLSTIALPTERLGQEAGDLLLRAQAARRRREQILLPFDLIPRGSTAPPAPLR